MFSTLFVADQSKLHERDYQDLIRYDYGIILNDTICQYVSKEYVFTVLNQVSDKRSGTPFPTGSLDLCDPNLYFWNVRISGGNIETVYGNPDRIDVFLGLQVRHTESKIARQVGQGDSICGSHRDNLLCAGVIDKNGNVPLTAHGLGRKRRKIYNRNGKIAGDVLAVDDHSDCALGRLHAPFISTSKIEFTSISNVSDTLHVHATERSAAHDVIVRGFSMERNFIHADIVAPGSSEGSDCGAACTTQLGKHLVGIHCEGHPANSPNASVVMIRADKFKLTNGACLELFPEVRDGPLRLPTICTAIFVIGVVSYLPLWF